MIGYLINTGSVHIFFSYYIFDKKKFFRRFLLPKIYETKNSVSVNRFIGKMGRVKILTYGEESAFLKSRWGEVLYGSSSTRKSVEASSLRIRSKRRERCEKTGC